MILTVAEMSFFAKITDPLLGGTYMTLMTTITNLGQVWMKTIFLWLIDMLTWKSCGRKAISLLESSEIFNNNSTKTYFDSTNFNSNSCYNSSYQNQCTENGGTCETLVDGFFVEIAFGVVFAIFWFYYGGKMIRKLQKLPTKSWHVLSCQREKQENVALKNVP